MATGRWKPKAKPLKWKPGKITVALEPEERKFLVKMLKVAHEMPKNEIEKRISKRFLMKLYGVATYYYPLYPDKECPLCEREFSYKVFDSHFVRCQKKHHTIDRAPKSEPHILEMMKYE